VLGLSAHRPRLHPKGIGVVSLSRSCVFVTPQRYDLVGRPSRPTVASWEAFLGSALLVVKQGRPPLSFSTNPPGRSPFDPVLAPFLQAEGLPFADVLTAADIEQALADEQVAFGQTAHSFGTPALTLWTFLSQVLDGLKSCRAAVARAFAALALSCPLQDLDTCNYCRARAKLATGVLRRLTLQVAEGLEKAAPAWWRWQRHPVVLVDGFTVSLPDTPANQQAYPQPNTQKPGLGFPLLRVVALLSLATAACQGLALGPYQGKESGEPSLFRTLLDQLPAGTIVVADRFYCSYFLVALLQAGGVEVVVRLHQRRTSAFRRGRGVGAAEQLAVWPKPEQPDWMDDATYAAMPETIQVREVRKTITTPGFRVKKLQVVTTLLDEVAYPVEDITDLYHQRWQVELDIRVIKATLKMEELRCLTPCMVAKESWAHFLGYNLLRKVAAQAAVVRGVWARTISFAASQQAVLGAWSKLTEATPPERLALAEALLRALGKEQVGHRPDRCEPRAKKRRPKNLKLLMKPRAQARAELLAGPGVEEGE
jgi:putative transposase